MQLGALISGRPVLPEVERAFELYLDNQIGLEDLEFRARAALAA
jgi:hypothetical protein